MTNQSPIVSVVMAAYKTEQAFFIEAVESILGQTLQNFEFIIVDDGLSNDNRAYLTSIADNRLKVLVNEHNCGQSVSVNKGIRAARGKYIARMDSDDIALPERLRIQLDYMETHPNVLACGGFAETTDKQRILPKNYPDDESRKTGFYFSCEMIHPTMMFRREAVNLFGIWYDEEQLYAQDYMIWTEFLNKGEIGILNDVVLRYRVHAGQITSRKKVEQDKYAIRVQKRLFTSKGFDVDAIDLDFNFAFMNYSIGPSFARAKTHLRTLDSQAKKCLTPSEAQLFHRELNFRALKIGIREIVRHGYVANGVLLSLLYGVRVRYWGYYIARLMPARPSRHKAQLTHQY